MMTDLMVTLFGTYSPIDGCPDWSYIGGVIIFCIVLYSFFRILGAWFK